MKKWQFNLCQKCVHYKRKWYLVKQIRVFHVLCVLVFLYNKLTYLEILLYEKRQRTFSNLFHPDAV